MRRNACDAGSTYIIRRREASSFTMSLPNEFPWDFGVYDAHCHPTDTMAAVASIPAMKATALTVMATRGEDQDLVQQTAVLLNAKDGTQDRIIPCFGWHPWFSHQILDDTTPFSPQSTEQQKRNHYIAILAPSPAEDSEFLSTLLEPKPLSTLIAETKERLQSCPYALVGEIGLDKSFRLPGAWEQHDLDSRDNQLTPGTREGRKLSPYKVRLDHQRVILKAQLQLAGEMHRAVSVHSVQAHGAVLDLLKELWTGHERRFLSRRQKEKERDMEGALSDADSDTETGELNTQNSNGSAQERLPAQSLPFPPRICMHSYSGPVEPIRQFLNKSNPSDVYFSFSAVINFAPAHGRKVADVIKALPAERILIESDMHVAGPQMDQLLEDVARQVCEVRGWELRQGVQQLAENWKRFVYG